MQIYTMNLPAYGRTKIDVGETVAFMTGDIPHLFLRLGSRGLRLPAGQCLPVEENYAEIVNPFPRPCEVQIARGLPIRYAVEADTLTPRQQVNCTSLAYRVTAQAAVPAGHRYGNGFLMTRGRALLTFDDNLPLTNSRVLVFRGASPAFLAAKPVGCMDTWFGMRFGDTELDGSLLTTFGSYTEAHIAAWIAAAGYQGEVVTYYHGPGRQYLVTATDAVFFARYNADTSGGWDAAVTCRHLGADIGDLD